MLVCVCVCVCVCERERAGGSQLSTSAILIAACVFVCVTFPTQLVVFGQSQCTGLAGQSEQTALVRRWGFVENEAFERGGA